MGLILMFSMFGWERVGRPLIGTVLWIYAYD